MADVGERGPTGDHGQHGDKGDRGEKGDPGDSGRKANRRFYIFVVAWLVFTLAYEYHDEKTDERDDRRALAYICQTSAENREAIRDSLKRSFASIGYRWDEKLQEPIQVAPPLIDYWKQHPEEIPGQLERLRQELDGFPPLDCKETLS